MDRGPQGQRRHQHGGTGVTGRDGTPEAVGVLLDKTIDGFGEVFRAISYEEIRTSTIQSRALAGVANATYVFCLPGSSGACRTAWDKLIVDQLDYRTRPCNLVELIPRLLEKAGPRTRPGTRARHAPPLDSNPAAAGLGKWSIPLRAVFARARISA